MTLRGWVWSGLAMLVLVVAFLVPGYYYWSAIGAHWARCVYGDPVCSLTVTTYALTFLTGAAFIAVVRAATFAKETIEHEKAAILALNRCGPGKHLGKSREFQLLASPGAMIVEISKSPEPGSFHTTQFDCRNVGRGPVIDGKLRISITPEGGGRTERDIEIGNLLPGKWIHVTLNYALTLGEALEWVCAVHKSPEQRIDLYEGSARLNTRPVTTSTPAPAATPIKGPTPPEAPAMPT